MKKSVVTVTINPAIDTTISTHNVTAEVKMRSSKPRYEAGGGGINITHALQRLGEESCAVYTSGGIFGKLLNELLDEKKISHHAIPIADNTRENIVVYEEISTQQYRFNMPGPIVTEQEQAKILAKLMSIDPPPLYLVLSGSIPRGVAHDYYAKIIERARKKNNMRVIVDTSKEALVHAAEQGVFLLKPNMRELSNLYGKEIENEKMQEEALMSLVEKNNVYIVLSLGRAGCVLAEQNGITRFRAPNVPIKSKVGAGDSMVAGIIAGLMKGWDIKESVMYGCAAGSAAVMTEGTELCRKADTEKLFEKLKSKK